MPSTLGFEPRRGEYSIIELAAPGAPVATVGVLLAVEGGPCEARLRDDVSSLAPGLDPDEREALEGLAGQLNREIREEGAENWFRRAGDSFSNLIRITDRRAVMVRDFRYELNRLFEEHVTGRAEEPVKVLPFARHLPVYTLRAAAGKFGEDMEAEPEGWIEAPERLRLSPDMFVAHITGRSMEPEVPDGSLAVFRADPAGSRQNMRVLVWRPGASGGEFTLKVYKSRKVRREDGSWEHGAITLEPLNPEYEAIELDPDSAYRVLGEFVCVVTAPIL